MLLQGSSQAAPHVAGVAALALSKFGKLSPAALTTKLQAGAVSLACPKKYQPYPDEMPLEVCESKGAINGFFGSGEVNALRTLR